MKISNELAIKFMNVSISLSDKEKEDIFFRQRDPNVLIQLAKYAQKKGIKSINLKDLINLYNRDVAIRKVLFSLIRSIEDKLTGAIVQRVAYQYPDFHLQSKNFELVKSTGKNKDRHFLTVNKFILDLKYQHHNVVKRMKNMPKDGYVHLEEIISVISLGMKAKLVKYSKSNYKVDILKAFNMTKSIDQINSAVDFFVILNSLRNKVMHNNSVIDWTWKPNSKILDIFEFIRVATYFCAGSDIFEEIKSIPELAYFKRITKKEVIALIL